MNSNFTNAIPYSYTFLVPIVSPPSVTSMPFQVLAYMFTNNAPIFLFEHFRDVFSSKDGVKRRGDADPNVGICFESSSGRAELMHMNIASRDRK
jgi:hypothetical protein